jgi:SAM-dependent methyltransferase
MKNTYSATWLELFLAHPDEQQTEREVDFLCRHLPRERISSVLDLCCGYGRHAALLAQKGYVVLGVDRNPHIIHTARSRYQHPGLTFAALDMTRLDEPIRQFDAVICMWQSFGYHDSATNRRIIAQIARHLNPGGRFVLDLYNRAFFAPRQGQRTTTQKDVEVITRQRLEGDRLLVDLVYGESGERDAFDWEVFTPGSLRALVEGCGFRTVLACTGFDEQQPPTSDLPRMQFVFEM